MEVAVYRTRALTSPSRASADTQESPRCRWIIGWERRGPSLNEAFSSARNRTSRTTHDEGSAEPSQEAPTSNGHWSRFGRRDRIPGEGPIGPPADGSAGFAKFAGYDRKRERQASQAGPTRRTTEPANGGLGTASAPSEDQQAEKAPSSADKAREEQTAEPVSVDSQPTEPDLAHHASSILGSLRLDEEAEVPASSPSFRPAEHQPVREEDASWSPSTAQWLYRDPDGIIQGPFTATDMQSWYEGQYFADDLMIQRAEDQELRRWPRCSPLLATGRRRSWCDRRSM
ncbi:hypothetical protein L7F22_056539 [Adiantum nelumboides]|nr:hypothetical protein [Adiantum nelumboides]